MVSGTSSSFSRLVSGLSCPSPDSGFSTTVSGNVSSEILGEGASSLKSSGLSTTVSLVTESSERPASSRSISGSFDGKVSAPASMMGGLVWESLRHFLAIFMRISWIAILSSPGDVLTKPGSAINNALFIASLSSSNFCQNSVSDHWDTSLILHVSNKNPRSRAFTQWDSQAALTAFLSGFQKIFWGAKTSERGRLGTRSGTASSFNA